MSEITYSGYVAIIGRPNVGKSTLLNAIIGQKLSITTDKPQTTRHQITGVYTKDEKQIVFVDTPGIHLGKKTHINKFMNQTAVNAFKDVDLILFVVDVTRWTKEDESVLAKLKEVKSPVFLVINKIDRVKDKKQLLPQMAGYEKLYPFTSFFPLSAINSDNLKPLVEAIVERLPEGPHYFPREQKTDRGDKFITSEIIREKLMNALQQEVPYQLTVQVERFGKEEGVLFIDALIWVETEGQKAIVIGKQGQQLKRIGQQARLELERRYSYKVMLKLWVNVKSGWSDDARLLKSLGYE